MEIRNNSAMRRFEMMSGENVAFVEYDKKGDRVTLTHTEVPKALSGQGVGSKLAQGVLDQLRADGAKVVPRCEFVAAFVKRHPEYSDLIVEES